MSDAFIPFTAGGRPEIEEGDEDSGKVLSKVISPKESAGFKSFLAAGSGTGKRSKVELHDEEDEEHGVPKVTLRREGNVVTHIEILCSCGAKAVYACDYDGGATGKVSPAEVPPQTPQSQTPPSATPQVP